jgi:hypothetical protein
MNANGTSVTELADSLNIRGALPGQPQERITVAADQAKALGFQDPIDEDRLFSWSGPGREPGLVSGRASVYSGVESTTFREGSKRGRSHGLSN